MKTYETRFDRFRVQHGIGIMAWARTAGLKRTQLGRYRAGVEPRVSTVARLVRAASQILRRPVKAGELFDVGEDMPVSPVVLQPPERRVFVHKTYTSRFDELMRRTGWPTTALAVKLGLSRVTLLRLRSSQSEHLFLPTIRQIVTAFRRMGYHVRAADVIDVGEE